MANKLTQQEVEKEINDRDFELLSEYKNARIKIIFKDSEGYYYSQTYSNFKNFGACKFSPSNLYTIQNINLWLFLNGSKIRVVSDEYTFMKCKLLCQCEIDKYQWYTTWHSLSLGNKCPKCAGNAKLTIKEIKRRTLEINPNIEILNDENEQVNAKTRLKCKCTIDGNIWSSISSNLFKGCGCKQCMIRNMKGENCYAWKGGVTPLSNHLRSIILPWKIESLKSCNYRCVISNIKENIIVHHIKGFNSILEETLNSIKLNLYDEISKYTNIEIKLIEDKCLELHYKYGLGVCLNKEIHDEFHKIYGKGNNTFEQFEEFKKNKLR